VPFATAVALASISGRNSFQRPKEHAVKLLTTIMKIYAGEAIVRHNASVRNAPDVSLIQW